MISEAGPLVFVVWILLIIRGESKQVCPMGLMSSGAKGESSGVINGKSLLQQKYLNQRFSVVCFTVGACRCGPAACQTTAVTLVNHKEALMHKL